VRRLVAVVSCLFLLIALPVAAEKKAAAKSDDGWPDTREGVLARRWVEAFSKGEKAMRAALPDLLTKEALVKTPMDERMERYRSMHDRLGSLMLVKVESSAAGELVAVLATSEMAQLPVTFKVQTEAPFRLISVSASMPGGHSHGGGFSH
jgi:hypothetical protein